MTNLNGEDNKHNNLVDDSKITIVSDQKESKDDKTKKKKKNKYKKNRNDKNRRYSNDKNIISFTKIIKEEIKDSIVLDKTNNIKNEEIKNKHIDTSHTMQINKNRCILFLPVIFIFILLLGIYLIYIMYHCLPLILKDYKKVYINYDLKRGIIEIIIFHFFLIMYLVNYILSIIVPPGSIPNTEEWVFNDFQENYSDDIENYLLEKKKTGERRYCKWCCKYKPDRTHHCRVCKTCVLKMDHHCPWIYNCVGWKNHKYFMLSLIYCCITSIFVSITMFNSVKETIKNRKIPFGEMLLLLFGETLNSILALIVTCFLIFHIWLMIKAMTTIEFCEKQTNYQNQSYSKYYNKGIYGNFKDVFGDSPFLWFLPIDNRRGDGINFVKGYNQGYNEETSETIPIKGKY
ncbi:palmitoyltransferase, putative [Plasmodium relictum]|uniref:Palmitoyltransferase n=1 Tax=Plasmodium relictum TaxID=85471 RepID=A0A1J1H619_PLARL|nr:palmitoyltransferase, putative [Plasmodium relictum]CRH00382.1 palmitoyltransferase, putative [Plasmodium relictum]